MKKKRKRRQMMLRRARKMARYLSAWMLVLILEALITLVPVGLVAANLIPLATHLRGGPGIGGEYLFLVLLFLLVFYLIHNKFCNIVLREEEPADGLMGTGREIPRNQHTAK